MSNPWIESFDLFVSYARVDNGEGMVTFLVQEIKATFEKFSPENSLNVFFDQEKLKDLQDWQRRIESALGQSKVMLAIVSPKYFDSEWCRREWESYLAHEHRRTYPGESIQPVFIIAEHEIDTMVPLQHRAWWEQLRQRNGWMAEPWWRGGLQTLQQNEVRERLHLICEAMNQHLLPHGATHQLDAELPNGATHQLDAADE